VLGQLDPPDTGTVTARDDAGELASAEVDELGFFALRPVPTVPYRLVCSVDSGITILTGWVTP
jgi:hypothetical protein